MVQDSQRGGTRQTPILLVVAALVLGLGAGVSLMWFTRGSPGASGGSNSAEAAQLYEFVKWMLGLGTMGLTLISVANIWSLAESRASLQSYKEEIGKLIETKSKDVHDEFAKMLALQKEQYALARKIEDLQEPCIRHNLRHYEWNMINKYLEKFEELKSKVKSDLPAYDYELAANAQHYEATAAKENLTTKQNAQANSDPGKHRHDLESLAIENYNKALSLMRPDGCEQSQADCAVCNITRRLGNAYAGADKYDDALNCYDSVAKEMKKYCAGNCPDSLLLSLSFGHTYKGKEDYLNAAQSFLDARKKILQIYSWHAILGDHSVDKRKLYIEANYELANALTALGRYDQAIKYYDFAVRVVEKCSCSWPWLYQSRGDAYRKRGASIADFDISLRDYDREKTISSKPETHYRKGQAYFGKAAIDPQNAMKHWECAREEFEIARSRGYKSAPLSAYLANVSRKCGQADNADEMKSAKDAIERFRRALKGGERAQGCYELAVCYALIGDCENAIRYMNIAISRNYFVCYWENDMKGADFRDLKEHKSWDVIERRITNLVSNKAEPVSNMKHRLDEDGSEDEVWFEQAYPQPAAPLHSGDV
jgi:Tetratricopeptide repeat.